MRPGRLLLENPTLRARFACDARITAEQHSDVESTGRYEQLYRRLVDGRGH